MIAEGTVYKILPTVNVSETFSKREFVVEVTDNPLYPQYVTFELVKDKTALIDNFKVGDMIEVTFNLRGREWTAPSGEKKYFNTLEAWRINPAQPSAGETQGQQQPEPVTADSTGDDGLLPF